MGMIRGSEKAVPLGAPEPVFFERKAESQGDVRNDGEPPVGAYLGYQNGKEKRAKPMDRKFNDADAGLFGVVRGDAPADDALFQDLAKRFGPEADAELANILSSTKVDGEEKDRYLRTLLDGKVDALRREHVSPWSAYAAVKLISTPEGARFAIFGEGDSVRLYRRDGKRVVAEALPAGEEAVSFKDAKPGERYLVLSGAEGVLSDTEIARILESPNPDLAERRLQEATDKRLRAAGRAEGMAAVVFDVPRPSREGAVTKPDVAVKRETTPADKERSRARAIGAEIPMRLADGEIVSLSPYDPARWKASPAGEDHYSLSRVEGNQLKIMDRFALELSKWPWKGDGHPVPDVPVRNGDVLDDGWTVADAENSFVLLEKGNLHRTVPTDEAKRAVMRKLAEGRDALLRADAFEKMEKS